MRAGARNEIGEAASGTGGRRPCRGTNIDRHTLNRGKFAGQRRKNPVHVVRLNPALQKFCRYREVDVLVRKRIEFEAPEPGRENFFPEFRAEPAADSDPRFALAGAATRGGRFAKVPWIGNLSAQIQHRSSPSRIRAKQRRPCKCRRQNLMMTVKTGWPRN